MTQKEWRNSTKRCLTTKHFTSNCAKAFSLGRGGNEQKFLGEGQSFKGKLIGVLEVREARGDRMCQDALQELKMAIKVKGDQRKIMFFFSL